MSSHPPGRTLLITLSVALVCSLLVIAFLLGRQSAGTTTPSAAVLPEPPRLEEEPASVAPETEERRWPAWADLEEWVDEEPAQSAAAGAKRVARIERRPDGRLLLSNRKVTRAPEATSDPSGADESVSDYFLQMDLIRSEAGAGDPNAFAMDLIKAAMGGSTAGFDQLIDDTARMETAARGITPPPSCESYHQANLDALAESREVLESMKSALARRDIEGLTAIARNAQALQHKAEALRQMREQITGSTR